MTPKIRFNPRVKFIVSDVDETIADLYIRAEPEMISELTRLLNENKSLFLVSGAGLDRIRNRIVNHLPPSLRQRVLISHCSGAEVWGFDHAGKLLPKSYYSVYEDSFSSDQKKLWRKQVKRLIAEFKLKTYSTSSVSEFKKNHGNDPLAVMFEDRGPQITLEVVNGYAIPKADAKKLGFEIPESVEFFDLRDLLLPRALELFKEANIPVTPRTGGEFALDFAVEGVNKTTSIKYVIQSDEILHHIGLSKAEISDHQGIEIWGDKFSVNRGGTDKHMCESLPKKVRAIDFREEDPKDFLPGYNIVLWNGQKHLHHGLLEYLNSR